MFSDEDIIMETDERSGFIGWLSKQALPLRILAFSLFILLAVGLIFGATALLYYFNVSNYPRVKPIAVAEDVVVAEFATLPDDDSYPAALAVSSSGTLYTASYVSGAIWQIAPDASLSEIPQSREQIGSVISLEIAGDNTLYVLDHLDPINNGGAKLWRLDDAGLSLLLEIPSTTISQANDISIDSEGRLYISDLQGGKIFRFDGTELSVWWQVPSFDYAPAGLDYDAGNQRILISDGLRGEIYAIATTASDTEAERLILFDSVEDVGFNGIDLGANGRLYAADLLNNQVWEIELSQSAARVIAGYYRGSSTVAYDANSSRLFVNNWDQSWLVPLDYYFISLSFSPRLPFSVDVIDLGD
jgi:sugar lactone lactonase YvrE